MGVRKKAYLLPDEHCRDRLGSLWEAGGAGSVVECWFAAATTTQLAREVGLAMKNTVEVGVIKNDKEIIYNKQILK